MPLFVFKVEYGGFWFMEKLYQVVINGTTYDILSERPEEFIRKVESYVNGKITAITEQNPKVSLAVASIFTALNAAEDLVYEQEASDRIRAQVTEYSQDVYELKSKMEDYKTKYEEALKTIERLKNGI